MFTTHVDLATLTDYRHRGLLRQADHPTLPLSIYNYTDRLHCGPRSGWDDITRQCRGLIVHSRTGAIVARSFDKFFHDTDKPRDANTACEVYDKVDGSMGVLFYYHDTQQWIAASRGSFVSEQAVHAQQRVDRCRLDECGFDRHCSYVVEIVYPSNRIVVNYSQRDELILLAVFQQHTTNGWHELYPLPATLKQRWTDSGLGTVVQQYTSNELQSLPLSQLHQLDWPNKEGFVVRFTNGTRTKIKFDTYKRLHHAQQDWMSPTSLLASYCAGQSIDTILVAAPDEFHEWVRGQWSALDGQYNELRSELMAVMDELLGGVAVDSIDKKQYSALVMAHPYQRKNELFLIRQIVVAGEGKAERFEAQLFASLCRRVSVVPDTTFDTTVTTAVDGGAIDMVDKLVDEMKAASIG